MCGGFFIRLVFTDNSEVQANVIIADSICCASDWYQMTAGEIMRVRSELNDKRSLYYSQCWLIATYWSGIS